jgi:hypothetical protein
MVCFTPYADSSLHPKLNGAAGTWAKATAQLLVLLVVTITPKENTMPGTIRVIVGLLAAMACVGGMDTATDSQLLVLVLVAGLALLTMYSGVKAMQQ